MIGYGMAAYCFRGFISLLFILPKLIRNRAAGVFYRIWNTFQIWDTSTGHLINEGRSAAACMRCRSRFLYRMYNPHMPP